MLVAAMMAERVGFEPTVEFPLHTLSKRAPSTARTSLRKGRLALSDRNSQSITRLAPYREGQIVTGGSGLIDVQAGR